MDLGDWGKSLEREGKAALRATLLRLLPRPRRAQGSLDPAKVRRVLAVRHDARLGNLILLTPALALLKRAFPAAQVDVLVADAYGGALENDPNVHRVLTARALPGLRFAGYDLAIDFSPQHAFSLSSAVWTALSGAKRRVGFDRGDAAKFFDDLARIPAVQAHETENLAALVRHAAPALTEATPPTSWSFGRGERERGADVWASWGLDRESVALFLGARAEKRLDPAWFLELGARLARSGRKVALTGGPAERELLSGRRIPEGVLVAPEAPLRTFASAVAHARAVLSADTGPMHLAVALGVPTLQLFSHTEPWRFGYPRAPHLILETPGRHPEPDEAMAALTVLLSKKG